MQEQLTSALREEPTPGPAEVVVAARARDNMGGFLLGSGLVLAEPQRLVPSAWTGHIPFAFWVIDALRPRNVVELGTYSGCSYIAFLQAISALGLSTSCHAVDTWRGDAHAGYYGPEVYEELAAYHDPRYGGFSRLLRMSFDEALTHFADGSIDLLHIDGFHTYEAVSHDLRSWVPKLSARGLILMHDINVRERDFGVWRVWEEVSGRYPSFAFLHDHGLGVAWVGTDPMPEPIAWLTGAAREADATNLDVVRSYFYRLGSHLVDRLSLQENDEALARRTDEVGRLTNILAERDEALTQRGSEVSELASTLALRDEALARRADEIGQIAGALALRDETLAQRGAEIGRLTNALTLRNARIDMLSNELEALRRELRRRLKYWGLAPVVHAPRDLSRLLRRRLHPPRPATMSRAALDAVSRE